MYLVWKTGETHGILGEVLLIPSWGRGKIKNAPSQIENALSPNDTIPVPHVKEGENAKKSQTEKRV